MCMSTKRPPTGPFAMMIQKTPTPGRGGSNGDGPGAQFLAKSDQNDNSKFSIPTKRRANGQFRTIMIEKRSRELSASNGDAPGAYFLAKTGQNGPLTPIPRWGGYSYSSGRPADVTHAREGSQRRRNDRAQTEHEQKTII